MHNTLVIVLALNAHLQPVATPFVEPFVSTVEQCRKRAQDPKELARLLPIYRDGHPEVVKVVIACNEMIPQVQEGLRMSLEMWK